MPAGRPSEYTDEKAERICEQLAQGVPLKRICQANDMPSYMTVLRWQQKYPEFSDLTARAKEAGTHALADECLEIADGELEPQDKRIRIDTRIRLIGKWNSRAYGDKVAIGGDKTMDPIQTEDVSPVERLASFIDGKSRRQTRGDASE